MIAFGFAIHHSPVKLELLRAPNVGCTLAGALIRHQSSRISILDYETGGCFWVVVFEVCSSQLFRRWTDGELSHSAATRVALFNHFHYVIFSGVLRRRQSILKFHLDSCHQVSLNKNKSNGSSKETLMEGGKNGRNTSDYCPIKSLVSLTSRRPLTRKIYPSQYSRNAKKKTKKPPAQPSSHSLNHERSFFGLSVFPEFSSRAFFFLTSRCAH